ncbi:putative hydrolase [Methylomusa anaerophila]|uniref:Putative hydrolase n=1 Tax=Methylomusa anaerophila TaxID=1930071 RepID=A0A348AP21_9FIRM|nr:putative hydrolase [Methylomusa anaerophila]
MLKIINELALLSEGRNGICRLAFSEADLKARQYMMNIMKESGFAVRLDPIGNIIARYESGTVEEGAPAVVTGSHLDTVPEGGKYDGVLGVAVAWSAVQRLKEKQLPLSHPVEVVVFAAEESSRFNFATMGSKAMAGMANIHAWSKAKDQNGISFSDALTTAGLTLSDVPGATRSKKDIKAFVELHIEQGRILEQEHCVIGIVESIAAPTRLKITVEGTAAHAGTTPIEDRQDALVSAAMIILAVRNIAAEQSYEGTVATVGAIKASPGVINVIPGKVEMWVDIRGTRQENVIEVLQEIKDAISTIADDQDTPVSIEVISSEKPAQMDEGINELVKAVCRDLNIPYTRVDSRAGHDAMNMAHIAPTALIFLPCHEGISHNPEEFVATEHISIGIDVLTETIYRIAK